MIVGFNHNISYRGTIFHVQTEDSGLKKPHLVTLLYHGGTIISSKKTVYADIIKVDNLDQVVEELAKEQHKGMLKRLTAGEFDERIVVLNIPIDGQTGKAANDPAADSNTPKLAATPEPQTVPAPESPAESVVEQQSMPEPTVVEFADVKSDSEVIISEEPIVDKFRKKEPEAMTLDELAFAYLTAGR